MVTRALPAAGILKCLNDQVQVFDDIISLSMINRETHLQPQVLKSINDVRNAFQNLEKEYRKLVDGIPGFDATALLGPASIQELTQSNLLSKHALDSHFCTPFVSDELFQVPSPPITDTKSVQPRPGLAPLQSMKVDQISTDASSNPWHPANIIFSTDFDATCTVVDSCEALVKAAEVAAKDLCKDFQSGNLLDEYNAILDRHSERTKAVLDNLEHSERTSGHRRQSLRSHEDVKDDVAAMDPLLRPAFESTIQSSGGSLKRSKHGGFDDDGLRRALLRLSDLEVICNEEVMSSGVLRGSSKEEILHQAKEVEIRSSCHQVLQALSALGTAVHIVSANWSRDLVKGGLPKLPEQQLFVHCNDISFNQVGVSTGSFDQTMVDAFDKENMLHALRSFYESASNSSQATREKMLVYMGDSHTDLLALLEADLGIVIGNSMSTRRIIELYGVRLHPISEAAAFLTRARSKGLERSWKRSGVLFEAGGWEDVQTCLFSTSISDSSVEFSNSSKQTTSSQQQLQFSQEHTAPIKLDLIQVAC